MTEPEDYTKRVVDATVDADEILRSVMEMDSHFTKAELNDEAKFGILRQALMRII